MSTLSRLELRIEPASFPATERGRQVVPYVDGESLLDSRRFAAAKKTRSARGRPYSKKGHAGLNTAMLSPDLAELRVPAPAVTREAAVLGCVCGDTYCNPVIAVITGDASTVSWKLPGDVVVRFARDAYDSALATACANL